MAIEVVTTDDLKEVLTPLVKEIKSLRTEIISQRRAALPEWLTVAEAAKAVKCNEKTIRRWHEEGKLDSIRRGKRILIQKQSLFEV